MDHTEFSISFPDIDTVSFIVIYNLELEGSNDAEVDT